MSIFFRIFAHFFIARKCVILERVFSYILKSSAKVLHFFDTCKFFDEKMMKKCNFIKKGAENLKICTL